MRIFGPHDVDSGVVVSHNDTRWQNVRNMS